VIPEVRPRIHTRILHIRMSRQIRMRVELTNGASRMNGDIAILTVT
jgi:hypothetical protein